MFLSLATFFAKTHFKQKHFPSRYNTLYTQNEEKIYTNEINVLKYRPDSQKSRRWRPAI
jgi:hypothetical protein